MRALLDKKGEILMTLCSFLMSPPMIPEDEQIGVTYVCVLKRKVMRLKSI